MLQTKSTHNCGWRGMTTATGQHSWCQLVTRRLQRWAEPHCRGGGGVAAMIMSVLLLLTAICLCVFTFWVLLASGS